jgi:hypothetical protein
MIGVDGRIQTRSYDRDGQKVYVTEVVADTVQLLESRSQSEARAQQSGGYQDNYGYQQQPAYQQSYQQPTYAQPTYTQGGYQNAVPHQPFAPDPTVPNPYEYSLTSLTGGMKFGWFLVGLFLTVPGMLLAWLVNADKHPQVKKDAITWSVIGFAVDVVLGIISLVAFASLLAAAISASGSYYGSPF